MSYEGTDYTENGEVPVSSNLSLERFLQIAAENIDIIEDALNGKGTSHAVQIVVYQRTGENEPATSKHDTSNLTY